MRRDLALVRAATDLVAADLRRALGPPWACRVDDDWVLAISDGPRTEVSLLDREVDDEQWFVNAHWSAEQQRGALAVEATEAVASEALEMLRVLDAGPLTCPTHGSGLDACEGVWFCGGGHDVAFVGRLGTERPFENPDPGEAG